MTRSTSPLRATAARHFTLLSFLRLFSVVLLVLASALPHLVGFACAESESQGIPATTDEVNSSQEDSGATDPDAPPRSVHRVPFKPPPRVVPENERFTVDGRPVKRPGDDSGASPTQTPRVRAEAPPGHVTNPVLPGGISREWIRTKQRTTVTRAKFTNWFRDNGGSLHPNVTIDMNERTGDFRLLASGRINPRAVIVETPARLFLTAVDPPDTPRRKGVFGKQDIASSPQDFSKQEALAGRILNEVEKGTESLWYPYFAMLPNLPPISQYFDEQGKSIMKQDLGSSHAHSEIEKEVSLFVSKRADWGVLKPFGSRSLTWAYAAASSRAWTVSHSMATKSSDQHFLQGFPVMVPGVDLANHGEWQAPGVAHVAFASSHEGSSGETAIEFSSRELSMQILAPAGGYRAGQEVLISYGRLANSELLTRYGFVLENNAFRGIGLNGNEILKSKPVELPARFEEDKVNEVFEEILKARRFISSQLKLPTHTRLLPGALSMEFCNLFRLAYLSFDDLEKLTKKLNGPPEDWDLDLVFKSSAPIVSPSEWTEQTSPATVYPLRISKSSETLARNGLLSTLRTLLSAVPSVEQDRQWLLQAGGEIIRTDAVRLSGVARSALITRIDNHGLVQDWVLKLAELRDLSSVCVPRTELLDNEGFTLSSRKIAEKFEKGINAEVSIDATGEIESLEG